MEKLLSFPDFRMGLLVQFAILSGADFDIPLKAVSAAQLIHGRFRESWIRVAAEELVKEKYLSFDSSASQWATEEASYRLTPSGLSAATEQASYSGFDLWEAIAELEERSGSDTSAVDFIPQGKIIEIDRSSALFLDLEREIKDTLRYAEMSNQLRGTADGERRIKEVEAGQLLLKADRVDATLIKRILLPALRALMKIALEESIKVVIKKAIDALIDFLPSGT